MDCVFFQLSPSSVTRSLLGLDFLVRISPVPFMFIEFLPISVTWGRKGGQRAGEHISSGEAGREVGLALKTHDLSVVPTLDTEQTGEGKECASQ